MAQLEAKVKALQNETVAVHEEMSRWQPGEKEFYIKYMTMCAFDMATNKDACDKASADEKAYKENQRKAFAQMYAAEVAAGKTIFVARLLKELAENFGSH